MMAKKTYRSNIPKEKKESKYLRRSALLFLIAPLIAITLFNWYPFIMGFLVAFQRFEIITSEYVGLENFKELLADPIVGLSLKNTFYYAFLNIALTFMIPIIVAILLMEMKKSIIRIMMILWFIPVASMASLVIWKWFYDPQYGLFNGILSVLGLPNVGWLENPRIAMISIVLPGLIFFSPGLIYMASLQTIPLSFYEAAELEGAGLWSKIWHISLPRLRPIIAMMLILSVINSMLMFQQALVLTGGGPQNSTRTVVMYIYNLGFQSMRFGIGAAFSLILFFILAILISIQRKYFKENIDV